MTRAGFGLSLSVVKKLLLVAYYTPPLGMSGVMRVTKLAKYLPRFGWEPLVLTVKPIAYYHYDRSWPRTGKTSGSSGPGAWTRRGCATC